MSVLSVISEFEYLPINTDRFVDVISCVSQEVMDKRVTPYSSKPVYIFKNSAGKEYFEKYLYVKETDLKSIVVISNHIPEELAELPEIMPANVTVDLIGAPRNPVLVNPQLLDQYDLVISIGRTVQNCFAMGKPVYVYDYFGGPGYIDPDNIEKAENQNFSGRGFIRKSAEEIKNEILSGYKDSVNRLSWLHDIANEKYNFAKTFKGLLSELDSLPEKEMQKLDIYENDMEEKQRKMYAGYFAHQISNMYCLTGTLYLDTDGTGLSENESIKWCGACGYTIQRVFQADYSAMLRFDPAETACVCQLRKFLVNGRDVTSELIRKKDECLTIDGYDYFITDDGYYLFDHEIKGTVEISYVCRKMSESEQREMIASLLQNLHKEESVLKKIKRRLIN